MDDSSWVLAVSGARSKGWKRMKLPQTDAEELGGGQGSVGLAQEGLRRRDDYSEWWLGFQLDSSWNNGTGAPIYRGFSNSISWRAWTQSILDFWIDSQLIQLFSLEIIKRGKVSPLRRHRVELGLLCDSARLKKTRWASVGLERRQAGAGRLREGRKMRKEKKNSRAGSGFNPRRFWNSENPFLFHVLFLILGLNQI
jgi:hypothetical protein